MADVKISPQYTREIPLNGRLRTMEDPCTIGASDFQVLQNMRYTDTHIKGIGGMTKINTAAASNVKVRNGIFFRKDQVAENFALIQALDTNSANPTIFSCTGVPPAQGSFSSLYVQATAAGTARFSTAPGDKVAICDGKEALLYGGSEMRVAGFIDYDPNGTYRYDYLKQVTNSLADANNVATVHRATGAVDSNTMLLLHFDGTAQDSSPTTPHNVGIVGVTYSATAAKFASAAYFNGSAYASAADNADFDFSGGEWTIDCWSKDGYDSDNLYKGNLFYQGTDAGNYISLACGWNVEPTKAYGQATFMIVSASATAVALSCNTSVMDLKHIAVVESSNDYYLFLNGALSAYTSSASRAANYTGQIYIGSNSTPGNYYRGHIDEFRISNTARWTSSFDPASSEYGASPVTSFLVGSTLPVKGIKFYVASANTGTGATTGNYWNGTSWVSVSSLSDGTSSASKPLAQTGTVSFADTASLAKLKAEDDVFLYWCKVEMSNVDTTTTISQITVDVACQTVKDIWDGEDRSIASFQVFKASAYNDYTTNVFEDGNYDSQNTGTFANISSLAASAEHLYCGFSERMQGIKFGVVGASGNTNPAVMSLEYFNGGDPGLDTGWTSVAINDQTNQENCSLGKGGLVTWQPPSVVSEFKTYLAGIAGKTTTRTTTNTGWDFEGTPITTISTETVSTPDSSPSKISLYYYRTSFSAALDASTALYYVAGIPAQETIKGYKFPVHHANRLWLCNNADAEPNVVTCSSVNTSQVFNGVDSTKIYLGNNEGLVAGTSLYTRMGSELKNMMVLCKYAETWAIIGETTDNFVLYRVSDAVGCVAPLTMATISFGEGEVIGIPRNFAIWQANHGIVLFDGANITRISDDIGDLFDPRSTTAINPTYLNAGVGFYDPVYHEYHFLYVGAGATQINSEMVFDVRHKKWYQVVRANALSCGFPVRDTLGNTYCYAGDGAGFVYRLENGNDMNGNGIAQAYQLGDIALHKGTIMENTEIDWSVLVAKAKTSATGTIAVTHYGDGLSTGTTFNPVDPTKANYRIVNVPIHTKSGQRTFHSVKFSMTTNDESVGFEPMFYGITYRVFRREA
jgi:hypothetical protein